MAPFKVDLNVPRREIRSATRSIENWFDDLWDEVEPIVDEYADRVWKEAWEEVPVDTGNLRSTIEIILRREAMKLITAAVGTRKTTYAHFQEFGTSIHRAQPYLRPALKRHAQDFVDDVTTAVQAHARRASRYKK